MGRIWSLFFLLVPILGTITIVAAPYYDHWLPKDVSAEGYQVDHLFNFILWITGIVFIGTEVALFWFMWKYDAEKNDQPAKYTHGSHHLEIVWTLLPAVTLLFMAIYQMNAWAEHKIKKPQVAPLAEVTARQFEWRIRYPGPDGKFDTPDDIYDVNLLVVPVDEVVLINLRSMDVLHSFFLPNLRVKQDALPGRVIPVWFRAVEQGDYDLVCAELCGWGHYKMKGRLRVVSREEYEAHLQKLSREQEATQ